MLFLQISIKQIPIKQMAMSWVSVVALTFEERCLVSTYVLQSSFSNALQSFNSSCCQFSLKLTLLYMKSFYFPVEFHKDCFIQYIGLLPLYFYLYSFKCEIDSILSLKKIAFMGLKIDFSIQLTKLLAYLSFDSDKAFISSN